MAGSTVVTYSAFFNNLNKVIEEIVLQDSTYISYLPFLGDLLNGRLFLLILVQIVIAVVLTAHLITLVKGTILDQDCSIIYTLKNIWYYIGGSIFLVICMLGIMIPFLLLTMIPIIGLIGMIGLFVVIFYFIGYFRFIPYYAFITRSFSELFSELKRLLSGKFWQSILIVVIFYLITLIVNSSVDDLLPKIILARFSNIITKNVIVTYLIAQVVVIAITSFEALVDISFIALAIKTDNDRIDAINKKRETEQTDYDKTYYQNYIPPKTIFKDDEDSKPFNL
jgi:hypothetical protein